VTPDHRAPALAPALVGGLTALYLLSGRWAVSRLSGDLASPPVYLEVRVWVVGLLAATALLANVRPRPGPERLVVALVVLFLGWAALTVLWAPDAELAGYKAYELLLVAVATVSLARVFSSDAGPRALAWTWAAILVVAGLLAALALPGVVSSGAAGGRLAVLAGGPNVFARIMGFLAVAALFFWRRHGHAWLFMPVVALAALLVVLSGSRGGLLSMGAAVVVFLAIELRDLRRTVPALLVAAAAFLGVVTSTRVGQAALETYDQRVKLLLLRDRYSAGRTELYRSAWRLGKTAPVLGRGLAAFPAKGLGVYPHNLFLETFCETGLVGLWLLGSALAAGAFFVARRRGGDGATVAGLVLILAATQFSGDLYDSRGVFVLLVAASVAPAATRRARAGPAPPEAGALRARLPA
jgi:O-antigen ligase